MSGRFCRIDLAGLRRALAATLLVMPLAGHAAPDAATERRLAELLARAYDHPQQVLSELKQLEPAQADATAYVRARVAVLQGELEPALQWARQGPQQARQRLVQGLVHERQGRNAEAAQAAGQVIAELEPACKDWKGPAEGPLSCDFRPLHDAQRLLARTLKRAGQLSPALQAVTAALALSRAGQDEETTARDLAEAADLHELLEQPELARRALTDALRQAAQTPRTLAAVKSYEAALAVRRNDRETQRKALEEALALARQADLPRTHALLQAALADFYLHADQPEQARKLAEAALPLLQRFGEPRALRTARHNLAVALVKLRAFDAARAQIALLEQMPVGEDDTRSRAEELRELGEAWTAVGLAKEALAHYHAERRLTLDVQQRAREAVLAELRAKYDADQQKAKVELLRRERAVQDQTLANQSMARKVTGIGAVLLGLCAVIAVLALVRMRKAHLRLRANQALLQVLSERDPLTQLANRRHFLAAMQARGAEPLTGGLLMLDIDHFKRINDSHGHGAGDQVIQAVAKRLQRTLREGDLLVRWGGEEFLIMAPSLKPAHVQLLADRLLIAVADAPISIGAEQQLRVTISIGFVCFPLPPAGLSLHWERAVNWADLALYAAKHRGRNRAVGITEAQAEDDEAQARIEADFEGAALAARIKLAQVNGPLQLG
ncbi:diguanylate cyclase domain-containing protein [Inhella sp.]|uniref:diguanylate cyclase domain-containing protein n=1 Tax=Inhella sp. TaxID=1921806 RepID=UPI0035B48181